MNHQTRILMIFIALWAITVVTFIKSQQHQDFQSQEIHSSVIKIDKLVVNNSKLAVQICERSKNFDPYLAKFYKRNNVFPPRIQLEYEKTIPKGCK